MYAYFVINKKANSQQMALLVAGVSVYGGGPKASALLSIAEASPFHLECNTVTWIVEIVEDVVSATDLIHQHGRFVQLPVHLPLSTQKLGY